MQISTWTPSMETMWTHMWDALEFGRDGGGGALNGNFVIEMFLVSMSFNLFVLLTFDLCCVYRMSNLNKILFKPRHDIFHFKF